MKHLRQHITHLVQGLLGNNFSYFLRIYSNMSLIICMMAMMSAPKAIDPMWYLKIHLKPIERDALDLSSDWPPCEKYHRHVTAAMMN